MGWTAQGLPTIQRRALRDDLAAVGRTAREFGVAQVVVGLPLDQAGKIGESAQRVLKFAQHIEKEFGLPVVTWDERFTTRSAERAMLEGDLSRKKRRERIDRIAAVLILQSFLDRQRATSGRIRFSILLGIAGGLLALLVGHAAIFLFVPPQTQKARRIVEVTEGESLRAVARDLRAAGLISNLPYFVVLGKITGTEYEIKPGEYELHTRMRPLEILEAFREGRVYQYEVLIPEGYNSLQISQALAEKGIADPDAFLRLTRDRKLMLSLGVTGHSMEGYLFPDTYHLSRGTPPDEIVRRMARRFREIYTVELQEAAARLGMKENEVVTLASIIEKETGVASERPLISAVFHNRLKRGIPLQSDPTVIYALLPGFDGNLRRRDLETSSPYNTYRRRGLPPGPICSPGRDSLYAAVHPASVDYLYFVSRNDGTHLFSRSLAEHTRAVQRYQPRRGKVAARPTGLTR